MHEIEAKIKVAQFNPVIDILKQLGAVFMHDVRQVDTYFMDTHKLLRKNDCGLRIRRQFLAGQQTSLVTFKGPRRSQSQYKSRAEYETAVSDPELMEKIFESLGYAPALTYEKNRSVWQLDGCEVCLDELPRLGCFVEVEGPDEITIFKVLKKMNLQNQPHIPYSYASLMRQALKQESGQTENVLPEQ